MKITASGPDGRSTVGEVEGADEHTLVEIVELFEHSSQQDRQGGTVPSQAEIALRQAEEGRNSQESHFDVGMRAVYQLVEKTLNGD